MLPPTDSVSEKKKEKQEIVDMLSLNLINCINFFFAHIKNLFNTKFKKYSIFLFFILFFFFTTRNSQLFFFFVRLKQF